MTRQTHSMSSSPYSKSVSIEKSSNMRRETRSMSLSPHSTPILVEKSIDERNMGRQNRSDSVKVLESRKDVVGQSEKKKSKRVRVDDVEGKRKRVVEDEVNLGVKPKKSKVQKAEKVKIPDKVCKVHIISVIFFSIVESSFKIGFSLYLFVFNSCHLFVALEALYSSW